VFKKQAQKVLIMLIYIVNHITKTKFSKKQ
jgi:hypothetical protein